jgi:hypothetical protein
MGERRGGFVRAGFRRAGTATDGGGGGNIPDQTIEGNNIGAPGPAIPLTAAQVRTLLGLAAIATSGSASDIGSGTLAAARIADASLALTKLANIPDQTILGNNIGVAGPPIALTAGQLKTILGITTIVTSLNGAAGAATLASAGGTIAITGVAPALNLEAKNIQTVANSAALAALAAASLPDGSLVFVQTYKAHFELVASTQAAAANVRVAASGKAGYLWERCIESPDWVLQTTWTIDPTNTTGIASDENSGIDATAPLLTYSEHARRLSTYVIRQRVITTVLGDQQAADEPVYEFGCTDDATFNGRMVFVGQMTAFYNGTVTTYTGGAAGPSTDNGDTINDATLPVSATASGLLANGVLMTRTNSGGRFWWAAKDLGAKTFRISRPNNGTSGEGTLANGDTYSASTIPALGKLRFTALHQLQSIVISQFRVTAPLAFPRPGNITWQLCWFGTANAIYGPGIFQGCVFGANTTIRGWSATSTLVTRGGMMTRGGSLTVTGLADWVHDGRWVFQGAPASMNVSTATLVVNSGDFCIYDTTATALSVIYWGFIYFTAATTISGNNNTAATVVSISKWSQIAYELAAPTLAGTYTGGTPLAVGPTSFAVSGLPYLLDGAGQGFYRTDVAGYPYVSPATAQPALFKFSGTHLGGAAGVHDTFLADEGAMSTVVELTASPAYPMPARTARNLRVNPRSNNLAAAASVTLMKNGVATAMTVNIPAASTAIVTDLVDTVAFAANDTLDLRVETTAAGAGNALTVSAVLEIQ